MNVLRLYRTVRHLRLKQMVARLRFRIRRVRVGDITQPNTRAVSRPWVQPASRCAELRGRWRFRLLNQDIDVDEPGGWNSIGRDKLLLYHLHYLDVLNDDRSELDAQQGAELIECWILGNSPPDGNGWEPYPLSIRIVNLIKWHLKGNYLSELAAESLFLQARALAQQVEYHLLANHLWANAKALYFAGLFFSHPEAAAWRTLGIRILQEEIREQILPDGGHFERSPMYQAIIAEDLLDLVNLSNTFGDQSLKRIDEKAGRMLGWLALMTHPDGQLAYFNDATQGVTAPLRELRAYAARLNIDYETRAPKGICAMPDSGYVRYNQGLAAVIIDVGKIGPNYQPGHAHCDLLSFELTLSRQRYLVNTGVSTYNDCDRRYAERATAAHNTVSIDRTEQSEIWGAFRVGRRAEPFDVIVGDQDVQAAHDGYRCHGIIHRRCFEFSDNRIQIEDILESPERSIGVAHFHFHPYVKPTLAEDAIDVNGMSLVFGNARSLELLDYEYCAGFNNRLQAKKIAVTFENSLTTSIDYENLVLNR